MQIQQQENNGKGMFYIEVHGEIHGRMIYHMASPDHMIIDHTEADDELREQHAGYQLVQAGVEYARRQHMLITPWCPFAKKLFDAKPEWSDVLKK